MSRSTRGRTKTSRAAGGIEPQAARESDGPKDGVAIVEPASAAGAAPPAPARFDVVVLVASAGGLEALGTVLNGLPEDFPAAVIVAQHLGGQGSSLVEILGRRTPLPVSWAATGARLTAGQVLVCPARRQLEILPDGTCAVGGVLSTRDKPLDVLLESIADSYGARGLGVVLTGMGRDAAAGASALRRAGGVVLVQSEETAAHPSMPHAAIASGASDLVLPLHEIAGVIVDVVTGGELPRSRDEIEASDALFAGDGEVPRLLRAVDWAGTTLGPVAGWPVSLRTTLRLVLDNPGPMMVLWGPDLIQLYNDHYRILMGAKHPAGLGQPTRACWPEVWHLNESIYARVLAGEPVALSDAPYPVTRRGAVEDGWFDLTFTPVRDETGAVAGVLATTIETTARVLSQRRLRILQAVTAATTGATNVPLAMQQALTTLGAGAGAGAGAGQDVPFALSYLLDSPGGQAQLVASVGVETGGPMAPHTINVRAGHPGWPLTTVLAGNGGKPSLLLTDLAERFRGSRVGPGGETPGSALLLPVCPIAGEPPAGVLVCGLNPRLTLDDVYRGFLELVAARVGATMAEAQVRQKERERIERLAELDRLKTDFFNNVSHEFRTPLTLLLAPLDELSRQGEELPAPLREEIRVAARNARQLLNQVNTLLDFSQVEARRLHPQFESADLAALTRDIASVFRSAVERAGLRLRVDCPPLPEPVWVDVQMWEKIVGNLLSNALKFTFTGEIAVELAPRARHAELIVRDTGVGIPADEQAHVFERFHRVRGRRGRTGEGSGIGLALVYELVRLHNGRLRVESEEGGGTSMTLWLPMGRRPRREPAGPPEPRVALGVERPREIAAALAEEASSWAADDGDEPMMPHEVADDLVGPPRAPRLDSPSQRARILVVDDNVDLRDYLRRLLEPHWDVTLARDGHAARTALHGVRPDLVLADVMMPGLDGFELLREIRGDAALKHTPVVLVTARAGEEAAIEALRAGADDYIAKPFSPRELVARVHTVIERSRGEVALRERAAWLRGQRAALEAAVNDAPLATSLGALVRTATESLGEGTRPAFYLANEDGTALHHVVGMPDDYAQAVDGFRIGPEFLACGLATATGQAVLTTDVMTEPRWEPWRSMAERFDYRGCWSFPIHSPAGTFFGTLAVYWREPREASARELQLAGLLTQTASIIISRHNERAGHQQAEAALRASEARLAAELEDAKRLQQVSSLLIDPGDGAALPEHILDAAIAFTSADCGTVQLVDHDGVLDLVAWRNLLPKSVEFWRKVSPASGSSCGAALRHSTRVIVPDMAAEEAGRMLGADGVREYRRYDIRAAQSTPLVTRDGRLVGMLSTHWRRVHTPDEREIRLLDILARQAADFFDRRRTQDALRASEEWLRRMTNVPGIGLITFDIGSGALIDANEAFLAMTGYTREQVERRELTWRTMTPPEYVESSEEQLRRLAETGRIGPYEKEFLRTDGSRAWMLFAGADLGDGKVVEYCVEVAGPRQA